LKANAKNSQGPLQSSSSAKQPIQNKPKQRAKKRAVGTGVEKESESSGKKAMKFLIEASRALKYGDGVEWARGKTMIVGEGAAGKTSTVRSILGQQPVAEHLSTLGGEITNVSVADIRNFEVVEDTKDWKIATHRAAASRLDDIDALTRTATFRVSLPRQVTKSTGRKFASFIASKLPRFRKKSMTPQVNNELSSNQEEKVVVEFDEKLIMKEKDGETSLIMSFWDFGGQRVFYSLHHIFFTRYGICILVFSMQNLVSKDTELNTNTKQFIEFWLKFIHAHSPNGKIIMVGTFHDIVRSEEQLDYIDAILSEDLEIEAYEESLMFNEKGGHYFFPLDNSSRDVNRAAPLREMIESTMRGEKYIKETVLSRWIKTIDGMRALSKKPYLDVEKEIIPLANQNGITEKDEIFEMLSLFHRLGIFVHLTMTPTLSSRVITQPKWLLEMVTKLIRDPNLHVSQEEKKKMKKSFLNRDFGNMSETGEVSMKLMKKLLPPNELSYVVEFMEQTLLLCPIDGNTYLIPSLAKNTLLETPTSVNGFKAIREKQSETEISMTNGEFIEISCFEVFFEMQTSEVDNIELGDFDAFLSYAWGKEQATHYKVLNIGERLRKQDVRVWLDADQMIGDTSSAMANGIDHSRSMVVFITEEYVNKVNGKGAKGSAENCLAEFTYGGSNGLDYLIPVVLEKKMLDQKLWVGTFGLRIGKTLIFIDLSGASTFDEELKELSKEIEHRSQI